MLRNGRTFLILGMYSLLLISNFPAMADQRYAAGSVLESDCTLLQAEHNGWILDMCATDPNIPVSMEILVNGVSQGNAVMVRIYHQTQEGSGFPQVAILYASGFVRLKHNADPLPANPFGTSFILGPAYWDDMSAYHHHPQINRLEIDLPQTRETALRLRAEGVNQDFDVTYEMALPPPRDQLIRLHVLQTYTATEAVVIDATRRTEHQGFKLIQASSMFINEGGLCDDGYIDCHDSNAARFIGSDLERHQTAFTDLVPSTFIFNNPPALGSTWLDVLHTDDQSWQSTTGAGTSGNTPNVRIILDALPDTHTVTPQGRLTATTDPNEDNVDLWLHDDGFASSTWQAGQSDQIGYWLLVQDDPPDPWQDGGLRSGFTFLDFEGDHDCFLVKDNGQASTGVVGTIDGYADTAFQLDYDLGSQNGNWLQLRCNFDPPLDLSGYEHLLFDWRGDLAAANSLEIGLINPTVGGENIFARGYHHAGHRAWWGQMIVPFRFLHPWTDGTTLDPSQVSAFFLSVVKDPVADPGGVGRIAVDNLSVLSIGQRAIPDDFETVGSNNQAAQSAVDWLASQQQVSGLLKSWVEEGTCVSHTYDQALALIVFADWGNWTEADALVDGLVATQNIDGSWFKSRDCLSLTPVDVTPWEGDIAWAIYALSRYRSLGGTRSQAETAMQQGAAWLATRIDPADGCLLIDHTEGTLDAWWAFQSAGIAQAGNADKIKNCLLTFYWDDEMGRFKGGRDWWQPYLDNQTWGASFLKSIGEREKALRALSYAWEVFRLPAQGGQLIGLDGQAGPWSIWNEGSAQYIASGGMGANDLLREVLAQQEKDGAMPSSPDEFSGGGVWTTRWHGIAPTAWLYFAITQEPFHPTRSFSSAASQDGWILETTETGNAGGTRNVKATNLRVGDDAANRQYRAILSFDTSYLPDEAVITSVTLKFKYAGKTGTLPFGTHGRLLADVIQGAFKGNPALQLSDFNAKGTSGIYKAKALTYTNSTVDGWYAQSLLPADFQYINVMGTSQFRLRFGKDDNNDFGADFLKIFSGNVVEGDRPQLIIEYYLPQQTP